MLAEGLQSLLVPDSLWYKILTVHLSSMNIWQKSLSLSFFPFLSFSLSIIFTFFNDPIPVAAAIWISVCLGACNHALQTQGLQEKME